MANCPHCGAEIDHLDFEKTRTYSGSVTLGEHGLDYETGHADAEAHYDCPECNEEVANGSEIAESILKGEPQ